MHQFPEEDRSPDSGEKDLDRLFNDAATAMEILYDSARGGSGAAREMLRKLTDDLVTAAGRYGPQ